MAVQNGTRRLSSFKWNPGKDNSPFASTIGHTWGDCAVDLDWACSQPALVFRADKVTCVQACCGTAIPVTQTGETHVRGILIFTSTGSSGGQLDFGVDNVYVDGNGGQNARSLEMASLSKSHKPISSQASKPRHAQARIEQSLAQSSSRTVRG